MSWANDNIYHWKDCRQMNQLGNTLQKLNLVQQFYFDYDEYEYAEQGCTCGGCTYTERTIYGTVRDIKGEVTYEEELEVY